MDANLARIRHMSVKRTLKALEDRHFDVAYVEDRNEALKLVRSLIPAGSTPVQAAPSPCSSAASWTT